MDCPRCQAPTPEETLREHGGVCPRCLLNFAQDQDAPEFPGFEVLSVVGQGGMGVVYKALQKSLGRTVALKVLSPELSADPDFVDRFTREAQALAQLNHPNIVTVYDSGLHDRVPYLVMEFVDGVSLRSLLSATPPDPKRTVEIVSRSATRFSTPMTTGSSTATSSPRTSSSTGRGASGSRTSAWPSLPTSSDRR